jgi:hypothetical protein
MIHIGRAIGWGIASVLSMAMLWMFMGTQGMAFVLFCFVGTIVVSIGSYLSSHLDGRAAQQRARKQQVLDDQRPPLNSVNPRERPI